MQTIGKSGEQRKRDFFYRGKGKVGKGRFEEQFIGAEQEFGVVVAPHWLS